MFGKRNYFVFLGSAAALLSMVCPLHTRKELPEKSLETQFETHCCSICLK
jgi:hypothetical protein